MIKNRNMKRIRITLGILIAPAMVGLVFTNLSYAPNPIISIVETYPLALIIWLPTFLYCSHRGWLNFSQLLLAGVVLGLLVTSLTLFVMILLNRLKTVQEFFLALYILGAAFTVSGLIVAVIFWIIAFSGSLQRGSTDPAN